MKGSLLITHFDNTRSRSTVEFTFARPKYANFCIRPIIDKRGKGRKRLLQISNYNFKDCTSSWIKCFACGGWTMLLKRYFTDYKKWHLIGIIEREPTQTQDV